jgi:hypothetical protein
MSTPTTAVMVKGMDDEAPFLREFVLHYISLGFDRIYYINTSISDHYLRSSLPSELLGRLIILNMSNTSADWEQATVNEAVAGVREDWVLNVDVDEFLYLGHRTIGQFLTSLPPGFDSIRFPWLMCLSTQYTHNSVFDIRDHIAPSKLFKSMARTPAIRRCRVHDIETVGGQPPWTPNDYRDEAFILHFACRGLFDLINRIVGRHYASAKSGPAEISRLLRFFRDPAATAPDYPFRFNLYRVELGFPSAEIDLTLPVVAGFGIDTPALKMVFRNKMNAIGLAIPCDDDDLESYIETTVGVRERLLVNLPSPTYARMHLENGTSYVNITHQYVASLARGPSVQI